MSPEVSGSGPWRVTVIESERGWGQKVDSYHRFQSQEQAEAFARDYNKTNPPGPAPDWYMQANTPEYQP